ncbi:hypothetical protein V8B97DRAFT_2022602 [Scleroderma yunnanense]
MFKLSDHGWKVLEELCNILKVSVHMLAMCYIKQINKHSQTLKHATLYFLHGSTYILTKEHPCLIPTLTPVIPAMDLMDRKFTSYSHNLSYSVPIHTSIELVQKTLSCYYSLMDKLMLYCIIMILHPCYKLMYFKGTC